jgi:hypothetical protein
MRNLCRAGGASVAAITIGGERYAEVATVDHGGRLIDGPHSIPAVDNPLVGQALPDPVRAFLRQAVPARVASPLRQRVLELVEATPLRWGDPGPCGARLVAGGLIIHAALPEYLEAHALLAAIADEVTPLFTGRAAAALASDWTRISSNLSH